MQAEIYGLKQASRQWNLTLSHNLLKYGFTTFAYDHCLYLKQSTTGFLALLVYVDDILLISDSPHEILQIKDFFTQVFYN